MKDHKENFNNNPTVRLMNNNCNVHSKDFLDTVNKSIPETTNLNQWRNAETVSTALRLFAINSCASLSHLTLNNFMFLSPKTCSKRLNFRRSTNTSFR